MEFSREIEKSLEILREGKLLLYPTDTVWGIGCDATQSLAVQKIYRIKQRDISKPMIVLVESFERLSELVEVSKAARRLMSQAGKPLTIVYETLKGVVAPNLLSKDKTLAIRLTEDPFCKRLIQAFGKAIVSTSANRSGVPPPISFDRIDSDLLDEIDYIVNLRREEKAYYESSSVVKLSSNGKKQMLRK
ncbi:MAG: L-threonylcarbamoyladenylate synthase [Flavobacteriales bacterium Tduv]